VEGTESGLIEDAISVPVQIKSALKYQELFL
jgi:hypothetical protein